MRPPAPPLTTASYAFTPLILRFVNGRPKRVTQYYGPFSGMFKPPIGYYLAKLLIPTKTGRFGDADLASMQAHAAFPWLCNSGLDRLCELGVGGRFRTKVELVRKKEIFP